MKTLFLTITLLFFLSSCNNNQNKQTKETVVKKDTTLLTKNDIDKITYVDYGIDSKAKNTLDSWQSYNTIALAIDNLKKGDLNFFKEDNTVFVSSVNDLETTIPENINTEPIQARILILRTKLLKLEEVLNLGTSKKNEKLLIMKEVFEALSNVTLQINKKFEKEAQNIIKPNEI
ncbi:hypothetical protein [Lacinutrix sp. 5H-3-7-4]|uniref:hypothetical protein n=1 Tax=Lacinutrix sp. (strain 5H-3-7-4) TaxID=983544 RepID=UPI00020A3B1E|nr:hypothetical protein [Lacinutrix sp. 5H-3-7-4]AEH01001.1 hypothetical protein Lacal_1153 [Lacinutrix sp. 5H-3-7-4]